MVYRKTCRWRLSTNNRTLESGISLADYPARNFATLTITWKMRYTFMEDFGPKVPGLAPVPFPDTKCTKKKRTGMDTYKVIQIGIVCKRKLGKNIQNIISSVLQMPLWITRNLLPKLVSVLSGAGDKVKMLISYINCSGVPNHRNQITTGCTQHWYRVAIYSKTKLVEQKQL